MKLAMKKLRDIPISSKLMIIMMMTSCLSLVLACAVFVIHNQYDYRDHLTQELNTTAGIIGDNCAAALSFEDPESAAKSLQTLVHLKSLVGAAIYDSDGKLFARYGLAKVPEQYEPSMMARNDRHFFGEYAEQFRNIELAGEVIGHIYLRHDMSDLHQVRRDYLGIAFVVLLVVSLIVWVVSSRLRRVISEPVASLAGVVAQVVKQKDFSVRAVKQGEDELGQLIDGFNGMLDRLQRRDSELERARNELERRVEERTAELASSIAMLNATLESTADGILALSFSGKVISHNSRFARMWSMPADLLERGDAFEILNVAAEQVKDPELFHRTITHLIDSNDREASDVIEFIDGRICERHVKPQVVDGRSVGMVVNFRDVTSSRRTEMELRWKTAFLEAQSESSPDGMLVVNAEGERLHVNRRLVDIWKIPQEILDDPVDETLLQYLVEMTRHPQRFMDRVRYLIANPEQSSQDEIELRDGRVLDRYTSAVVGRDGSYFGRIWSFRDITERKRAEAETELLNKQLVTVSRQAGMSEVATSVLHNVGNVLNSVNISCSVISDLVRKSRISSVTKTAGLLQEHENDLAAFLTTHPNGSKLPEFLGRLATRLTEEQSLILTEIHLLDQNIEHIKDIISVQQNYARNIGGVRETLSLEALVEDALRMNKAALVRHGIKVIRKFEEQPPIQIEKHNVLQILVNLIRNAKHALVDGDCRQRVMTIGISGGDGKISVCVSDNGIGIDAENLTRIFAHGFTTKKDGHGFGLHSGVLAAQNMGGSLVVHSDGPGKGAAFTLELPIAIPATH